MLLRGILVGVDELLYPALGRFPDGSLKTIPAVAYLTLNTTAGLRQGYYDDLRVVDSRGKWFRVRSARKLRSEGRIGYNVFNQRIRVELDLEDEHQNADVEEIRTLILNEFRSWPGWRSRGDFHSLRQSIVSATTIPELLGRLAAAVT
jgi:hypothetical protein